MNVRQERIAFLFDRGDVLGGASLHILGIAGHLSKLGHMPHVVAGGTGAFTDALHEAGISHEAIKRSSTRIGVGATARSWREARRALEDFQPTLLAAHATKSGLVARLLPRRCPILYTPHGWPFAPGIKPFYRAAGWLVERTLAHRTDQYLLVCDYERELARRARLPAERAAVVHNGARDMWSDRPPPGRPLLLSVARFEQAKDHESLIRSFALLRDDSVRLRLVGAGEQRADVERLVELLGISERVEFWGEVRDLAPAFDGVSAFVLSSHWESFPLAVLEAMSAGIPVICSDVGGISEAIRHEQNGLLVKPGSPQLLAGAITRVLDDEGLAADLAVNARKDYLANHTVEASVRKAAQIYLEAARSGGRGR